VIEAEYSHCFSCLKLRKKTFAVHSAFNGGISAASFCHQVAALVPDRFCSFYLVKNHKIANNSATIEAREKISTYLESL
jgi:hypothetical protein